jgi:hypothetical protein
MMPAAAKSAAAVDQPPTHSQPAALPFSETMA